MKRIGVIIVTYGLRSKLLNQTIYSLIEQVNFILIVNNDGEIDDQIRCLEKIRVIEMCNNAGPAEAFNSGLDEISHNKELDYILLLDDDMVISGCNMDIIIEKLDFEIKNGNDAIIVPLRSNFIESLINSKTNTENIVDVINVNSGFNGFDLWKVFNKGCISLNKKNDGNIKLNAAPYGGIFGTFKTLTSVTRPPNFTNLYTDDFIWTYLMYKQGINIILDRSFKFRDIDGCYHTEKSIFKKGIASLSGRKLYFMLRNLLYFEFFFIEKKGLRFLTNTVIYIFIVLLQLLITLRIKELPHFFYAIIDFLKGNKNYRIIIKNYKNKFIVMKNHKQ